MNIRVVRWLGIRSVPGKPGTNKQIIEKSDPRTKAIKGGLIKQGVE